MEKLGLNLQLILWQMINFGILLFVLNRFLYKPVLAQLKKRKAELEANEATSRELEASKALLAEERENLLAETRAEAKKVLDQTRAAGKEMTQTLQLDAQKRADEMLAKARQDIAAEREEIKAALQEEVSALAVSIAEQVLRESVTPEQKSRLTKTAIEKFIHHE